MNHIGSFTANLLHYNGTFHDHKSKIRGNLGKRMAYSTSGIVLGLVLMSSVLLDW